jgi:hypothetical protein|tara:strand:- start:110 stop:235 length:126 start_codon:yes stop_codon:yes gene_type:complete
MLDLYIKGMVVGDKQELLEMGCRLHGNDGFASFWRLSASTP